MTACTDDERRRVAEALRGSAYRIDSFYMLSLVIEAESCSASDVVERLADLIDPDCEEGRYSVARTVRPVDRDALLALAEEMDKWALTCDHYDWEVSPMRVVSYARRIREALEVGR